MNNSINKNYYKQFLTLLSGNTLSQLIPFIFAPILAYYFSKSEIGEFSNYLAIVSLFGIISNGRLELAIPLPEEKLKAQNIVLTGLTITFLVGLISILIPIYSQEISSYVNILSGFNNTWLIPIGIISYGLLGLANNWLLRMKNYKILALSKIIQSIANSGLAAILGLVGWGVDGLIYGWLISQFVALLVLVIGMDKFPKLSYRINHFKDVLIEYKQFPIVNSLHAFSDIFISQFLLFYIITSFYGLPELGLFSYMNRLVKAPIVLITSSVSQLFYVEANELIHQKKSILPIMLKTIKTALFFGVPFVICVFFMAPMLFEWYLGKGWGEAGIYARNISPVLLLTFVFSPISMISILFKKQFHFFIFSILGQFLSIAALILGHEIGMDFKSSLWLYSLAFTIYYVFLFLWYLRVIKTSTL